MLYTQRNRLRAIQIFFLISFFLIPALPCLAVSSGVLRTYSTFQSIGIEWDVLNDENHNAAVLVQYRRQGRTSWEKAMPLIRIDYNGMNMLSGSIFFLTPGLSYEVQLTMADPDGGDMVESVVVSTRPEPLFPSTRTFHVIPGSGGGTGTGDDPFKGIRAALANAKPGDVYLLHGGLYSGRPVITVGGTATQYVAWKAIGDGDVIFSDGIEVDASYSWLEGIKVVNQRYGLVGHNARGVVVAKSRFENNNYAIEATKGNSEWYIHDNVFIGDDPWNVDWSEGEAVHITGNGHVIAYNSISRVADGLSTEGSNIDMYGNDIFDISDDFVEMDNSNNNIRFWRNRCANVGTNLFSFQPQAGGPWYFIRNQAIGFGEGVFKFRTTDRFVYLHNTVIGESTFNENRFNTYLNAVSKNNIFILRDGGRMYPFTITKSWMTDIDYNGFDWGDASRSFRYNGDYYDSLSSFSQASGLEKHGVRIEHTKDLNIDYSFHMPPPQTGPGDFDIPSQYVSLKADGSGIDAGVLLPNINDEFTGSAPDLGAYEFGLPLPHYGPRSGPLSLQAPKDLRIVP